MNTVVHRASLHAAWCSPLFEPIHFQFSKTRNEPWRRKGGGHAAWCITAYSPRILEAPSMSLNACARAAVCLQEISWRVNLSIGLAG